MTTHARQLLEDVFGYPDFREHQEEIVTALCEGRDVLALMPTGGGKSLCYQIPSLIREGAGIVVSPLIALMQDQVDALEQLGIHACFLNSTQDGETQRRVEERLLNGDLDLLYLAPERLLSERTLRILERSRLALFAIDEAHCVSQWGHDFRKEYQQLSLLHQRFHGIPRIALTATADARTRNEIVNQLELQQAECFVNSFDRPNIRYTIGSWQNARDRLWRFMEQEHPRDSGIVYCLSRRKVEETADWLADRGRTALAYHAGLTVETRHRHQQRFLQEEGIIMVATIAFGMGIDKPDVRFVAHLNLPRSVEAYYQETGRAGRDGEPANAWMSFGLQDVITLRRFIQDTDADPHYKRVSQQKLESLLGLCDMTGCRRQMLLSYFGEILEQPCGNCDNCLNPPQTWDATEAGRKALSCVYRTGQRFGVNYLIAILRGGEDPRIQRNGHQMISTFGIGSDLKATEWRSLFRQLISLRHLEVDTDGHGALRLTERCRTLLRGDTRLLLRRQQPSSKRHKQIRPHTELPAAQQALFDALRKLRLEIAQSQSVPPYVIFHDATLRQMAVRRPGSQEQLGSISGVGEKKLAKYGQLFLGIIQDHAIGPEN